MSLTTVQQRTLEDLMGGGGAERPVFAGDLPDRLRAELESRLEPVGESLREGEDLWINKSRLVDLHTRCEGLYLSNALREGQFEFNLPLAKGNLVHRAIQVGVYRRNLTEAELVETSLQQLCADDAFADFCNELSQADRAELEAEGIRQTMLFRSLFPPFEKSWTPAVELPLSAELFGGKVVLRARPDICLGTTDPEEPMRARRLLLELKTGYDTPDHDEDVRFYALVATLRFGVPPFRVATVNLETGGWRVQEVTEELLSSAARRVADGCVRAAALLAGEEPNLRPGAWCGWCPRNLVCPVSSVRAIDA
ncbi:MAG: PD-(D/E)XK nuclease family protein [Actinomycetota bacterium]